MRGWLGPGLTEGEGTLDSLKAAGIEYVCDWGTADDQPFQMKNGLYVVPYTVDINDIGLIDRQGTPASTFGQYIVDAFDTLYREGESQARVLPIALHPFLIGAPHRVGHLVKALDYIRGHDRVWFARGGDILDAYRQAMAARSTRDPGMTITCPQCKTAKLEAMPTDACQFFYECPGARRCCGPSRAIAASSVLTVRACPPVQDCAARSAAVKLGTT